MKQSEPTIEQVISFCTKYGIPIKDNQKVVSIPLNLVVEDCDKDFYKSITDSYVFKKMRAVKFDYTKKDWKRI